MKHLLLIMVIMFFSCKKEDDSITKQAKTYCFEDTYKGDSDYNDLVVIINVGKDITTITPIALGSTYKIELYGVLKDKSYLISDNVSLFYLIHER